MPGVKGTESWVPVCGSGAVLYYNDPITKTWKNVCESGSPIYGKDPITRQWVPLCCGLYDGGSGSGSSGSGNTGGGGGAPGTGGTGDTGEPVTPVVGDISVIYPDVNVDLVKLVNDTAAGGVINLTAGTYRITAPLVPKANVKIYGPSSGVAVIDGSAVVTTWTKDGTNARWYTSTTLLPRDSLMDDATYSVCEVSALDKTNLCWDREQVWCNGARMTRVASLAVGDAISGFRFYTDRAANRIYIWNDPATATIEVSVTATAIDSAVFGVTIQNVTVQKFSSQLRNAAIHVNGASGWNIARVTFRHNHALGLRLTNTTNVRVDSCSFLYNGQLGLGVDGSASSDYSNNIIASSRFEGNNAEDFYIGGWESGGFRATSTSGGKLTDCTFVINAGTDIWVDSAASNWIIENNTSTNAHARAIKIEVSRNVIVRNNTIVGSGCDLGAHYAAVRPTWSTVLDTAAITVAESSYVEVYGNLVYSSSLNGIIVIIGNRTTVSAEGGDHIFVHDNTVIQTRSLSQIIAPSQPPPPPPVASPPGAPPPPGSLPVIPASHLDYLTGNAVLPIGIQQLGPDFNFPSNYPVYAAFNQGATSIRGQGINQTILTPVPNSMSAASAARIPPQPSGWTTASPTNPLATLRVDNASLSNMTIRGSDQVVNGVKRLYNGVVFNHQTGKTHSDLLLQGFPGDNGANPGETFAASDFYGVGNTYLRVEVSGKDQNGVPVGAAGFGNNYIRGVTYTDCYIHDMAFSAGITHYGATGAMNYNNVRSINNGLAPFNWEQCGEGGTSVITMRGCTYRPRIGGWRTHMNVNSATAIGPCGSITVNIHDPIYDPIAAADGTTGKFIVFIDNSYFGHPNAQRPSDVHLFIGGVPRPDLLHIATTSGTLT